MISDVSIARGYLLYCFAFVFAHFHKPHMNLKPPDLTFSHKKRIFNSSHRPRSNPAFCFTLFGTLWAFESIKKIFLYFSLQYQQQQQQPYVADPQQQQQQQQWNKNPIKTEIVDPPAVDDNLNPVVVPPSSYNAKTSERMRQDEG